MALEATVAWYGKHPAWNDYVTGSFHPPAAEPLRAWLKRGRDHLEKAAPGTPERGETCYVLTPPGEDRMYCGVLAPSRDGGQPRRVFPFTVFLPLPRRRYRRAYPLVPAYASPAWEEMRTALRSCLAHERAAEVERVLNGLAPEIPAAGWGSWRRFRKDVAAVTAADFLDTLHPGGREAAIDLIARALEALAPFCGGRLGRATLAFDLPVSGVLKTAAYQTAFWLRLCEAVLGRDAGGPDFFLIAAGAGRRLVLFLREPGPTDYALALAGVGDGGRIQHLDAAGLPGPPAPRAAVAALLEGPRRVADLFSLRWDRALRGTA
jgi:type VI secretion system ImpM family protein